MNDLLRLWVMVDRQRFDFMQESLTASGRSLGTWPTFAAQSIDSGVADWNVEAESIQVRKPYVGRSTRPPADTPAMQAARRFLTQWMSTPEPALLEDVLRWAVLLEAWEAVERIWIEYVPSSDATSDRAVRAIFEDIPKGARALNPMLTFAWASARASSAHGYRADGELVRGLISDGLEFHSLWRSAFRTDRAVAAGTLWMLAQRMLPTSQGSNSLDEASKTQSEVAAFVAERRSAGHPPTATTEAFFRAASAQIALARADLDRAVAESEFAITLDRKFGESYATGTRDLALELSGCATGVSPADCSLERSQAWHAKGLAAQDAVSQASARALSALRFLDREAAQAAVAGLDAVPLGQPQWTTVVYAQAIEAALWGDAARALGRLDAAKARHGVASVEHGEQLGAILLRRARSALLERLGACSAAAEGVRSLPESWRWVPLASAHLWAGNCEDTIRVAGQGIFDAGTRLPDRVSLKVLRAAALLIDPETDEELGMQAADEATGLCREYEYWLPIGLLPASARGVLLAAFTARSGARERRIPEAALKTLQELPQIGASLPRSIILTRREQTLLPLLATSESVPDIAASLQVSVNTVRKQVVTLRAKFGARSRSDLVRRARDAGLLRR